MLALLLVVIAVILLAVVVVYAVRHSGQVPGRPMP